MPLYEYRCTKCNHVFEVHHEVGASPGRCPNCGGEPRRIFTSVGLIFKGSGFHTTDYRKTPASDGASSKEEKKTSKEEKKTSESSKKTGGESSAGTESSETAAKGA